METVRRINIRIDKFKNFRKKILRLKFFPKTFQNNHFKFFYLWVEKFGRVQRMAITVNLLYMLVTKLVIWSIKSATFKRFPMSRLNSEKPSFFLEIFLGSKFINRIRKSCWIWWCKNFYRIPREFDFEKFSKNSYCVGCKNMRGRYFI